MILQEACLFWIVIMLVKLSLVVESREGGLGMTSACGELRWFYFSVAVVFDGGFWVFHEFALLEEAMEVFILGASPFLVDLRCVIVCIMRLAS